MNELVEKLKHLPTAPGIYVMKDGGGRVIYVGKAKNLKNRVTSYFRQSQAENPRTLKLIEQIRDFAIFVVNSETEALLLERTLIRHHRPLYNVLFTDDKEYPLLRVTTHQPWPTFRIVRKASDDGATYLGPFGSGSQLYLLLGLIHKIFPLVRCSPREFAQAKRPCNYYHMKQCLGPCTLPVDPQVYRTMVDQAIAVLQGRNFEVRKQLQQLMHAASAKLDYEQALVLRRQIEAMDAMRDSEQVVLNNEVGDCDIFGLAADDEQLCLCLMKIREAKVQATYPFTVTLPLGNLDEALFEFLLQYYGDHPPPAQIIMPQLPAHSEELAQLFGSRQLMVVPKRGKKKALLAMATRNAQLNREEVTRERTRRQSALEALQRFLGLLVLPQVMECLDISHHQGSATVASLVCFRDGVPSKADYRHYKLDEEIKGPDDFKSIQQIMLRRLKKAAEGREPMPDLLVIDGGKGQLNAALKALKDFPEISCTVVGLAKRRVLGKAWEMGAYAGAHSPERVFVAGKLQAMVLIEGSEEFRLLTHLRDEAHRFAISFHRHKQRQQLVASPLAAIPGIGPTLRRRILQHFNSMAELRSANVKELCAIKGITPLIAQRIIDHQAVT